MAQSTTFWVSEQTPPPAWQPEGLTVLHTPEDVARAYRSRRQHRDRWLTDQADLFKKLAGRETRGSTHRLLLLDQSPGPADRQFLRCWFRSLILWSGKQEATTNWLSRDILMEVLAAPHHRELLMGVRVVRWARSLILVRANLERLVVPMSWFGRRQPSREPDFAAPRIVDHGQTLELGDYDVAMEAILYSHDPEVRQAQKQRALHLDDSFGGALRRLRLEKGLTQSDFEPELTARQIRRLETGETQQPRPETRKVLAEKLGVSPDEIDTY